MIKPITVAAEYVLSGLKKDQEQKDQPVLG